VPEQDHEYALVPWVLDQIQILHVARKLYGDRGYLGLDNGDETILGIYDCHGSNVSGEFSIDSLIFGRICPPSMLQKNDGEPTTGL
jgi:hypothetical protein